jgi:hypothetical protein
MASDMSAKQAVGNHNVQLRTGVYVMPISYNVVIAGKRNSLLVPQILGEVFVFVVSRVEVHA